MSLQRFVRSSPYPSIISFGVDMMLIEKFTDESFFWISLTFRGLGWEATLIITVGESEIIT